MVEVKHLRQTQKGAELLVATSNSPAGGLCKGGVVKSEEVGEAVEGVVDSLCSISAETNSPGGGEGGGGGDGRDEVENE